MAFQRKNNYRVIAILIFILTLTLTTNPLLAKQNYNEQVTALKEIIENKDKEIIDLRKKVGDFVLQISRKDSFLIQKDIEVAALTGELTELESRMELGQRIMNDKNLEIKSLLKNFDRKKEDWLKIKNSQIAALNEVIATNRLKIKESQTTFKIYKDRLVELRSEFSALELELRSKKKLIAKRDVRISGLKEVLVENQNKRDVRSEDLKKVLFLKVKRIKELTRVLDMSKKELRAAQESENRKSDVIRNLEERLMQVYSIK